MTAALVILIKKKKKNEDGAYVFFPVVVLHADRKNTTRRRLIFFGLNYFLSTKFEYMTVQSLQTSAKVRGDACDLGKRGKGELL
jgi:hypothetical protein